MPLGIIASVGSAVALKLLRVSAAKEERSGRLSSMSLGLQAFLLLEAQDTLLLALQFPIRSVIVDKRYILFHVCSISRGAVNK